MALKKAEQPQQVTLFPHIVSQMPEGYYSGDKPNPNLHAFVEAHLAEHPYDPEHDSYSVPAFTKPIETTKSTAIYNMHTYWSKKPHDAIRQYIKHYTQPGDLVLDPFCGSGGTALAALMNGRKAIAIDRSPAATFITKNYCTPVDREALKKAFEELKLQVQPEIDWLYETRCDRCDGPAMTNYTVYSQVFECLRCSAKVPLFDCKEEKIQTIKGKEKTISACPFCLQNGFIEEINAFSKKHGPRPVLVNYICQGKCKPKRAERQYNDLDVKKRAYFEKYDLGKLEEINNKSIPYWYPTNRMMNVPEAQERWGVKWRSGTSNFRTVDELFTKRNLWALAAIRDAIGDFDNPISSMLGFAFSGILFSMTRMYLWTADGQHNVMKGTYYLPQLSREINVLLSYENKFSGRASIIAVPSSINTELCISTQTATSLSGIPHQSVDYIFTDPPYADKVQYGELNFLWEAWLGFDTKWHNDEIIVNEVRGKSETEWATLMRSAMKECCRILKPGHWISLCYHDTSEGTWALIQDIMTEVGFVPDTSESVLFIDTAKKSYNQYSADKVTKRDLVINFRKPRPDELSSIIISGDEDETTFAEKVHVIIKDYLLAHPGRTKDLIYDVVVSRMVRAGQMEAHNFDDLLRQVAELAEGDQLRWFLPNGSETKIDQSEYAKEEKAASIINIFIEQYKEENPEQEGVHYSNIFEHFLYAIPFKEKPRRSLNDWLQDYFYTTSIGTYRLPVTDEERAAKKQGRQDGTNRLIKRYLAYLQQNLIIPAKEQPDSITLAEWIGHCRRSSLYEQGRLLYEKSGLDMEQLSDEQQVEVDDDYQICVRRIKVNQIPVKNKPVQLNMQI